jgi:hypothetical protein
MSGTTRVTPSSVAIRTMPSILSPFGIPWARVRSSGDSVASGARLTIRPSARRAAIAVRRTDSRAPPGSTACTTSPTAARSTRPR